MNSSLKEVGGIVNEQLVQGEELKLEALLGYLRALGWEVLDRAIFRLIVGFYNLLTGPGWPLNLFLKIKLKVGLTVAFFVRISHCLIPS